MELFWIFASNSFMLLKNRSMKRFYKFVFSFMQALYAEYTVPDIKAIYDEMLPFFTAFKAEYVKWKSQIGIRKGDTVAQTDLYRILRTEKMRDWNIDIMGFFKPGSPEYTKIFPEGLTPFSSKSLDEILIYFRLVINNADLYDVLDEIVTEMNEFLAIIEAARNTQQTSGSGVKTMSVELKESASAMASELYGALGSLIKFHRYHPENIKHYFNLTLLRYQRKTNGDAEDLYELLLAAGETIEGGFAFSLTEKLMFYNSGETKLRFWFTADKDAPMGSTYFDLEADDVIEFLVSKYANEGDRFLMIKNLSDTVEGSVEIEKV